MISLKMGQETQYKSLSKYNLYLLLNYISNQRYTWISVIKNLMRITFKRSALGSKPSNGI